MDLQILQWVNENLHGSRAVSEIFKCITFLGNTGWFWIALALVLLIFKRTRKVGVAMAIALVLDILLVNVTIKPLVGRIRPYEIDTALKDFILSINLELPDDASFPSGHSGISFAGAMVLLFAYKKKGIAAVVLATLIALSRIYLCVHFPTDVLAGALIGSLCAVASYFTLKKLKFFEEKSVKVEENAETAEPIQEDGKEE